VIAHAEAVTAITPDDAGQIFSGAMRTWSSGGKIYVADQSETDVGHAFYEGVIKRPMSVVRMQWIQLILSGQAVAPKRLNGDAAVLEFVRRTPGAVGYVRSASVDGTVKELLRIDGPARKP